MTEFLQECYVAGRTDIARHARAQVAAIAAVVSASDLPIRLIGALLLPADETLFLLWQADTESVVREIIQHAGMTCDRITEVVAIPSLCREPA